VKGPAQRRVATKPFQHDSTCQGQYHITLQHLRAATNGGYRVSSSALDAIVTVDERGAIALFNRAAGDDRCQASGRWVALPTWCPRVQARLEDYTRRAGLPCGFPGLKRGACGWRSVPGQATVSRVEERIRAVYRVCAISATPQ
jgi:hypothetical protein